MGLVFSFQERVVAGGVDRYLRPPAMDQTLSKLNLKQREAVLHGNGPLLVLAGAGSGKTSTMAHRIAHLIASRHVPPEAILGLSFTNKAAQELRERVKGLVTRARGPRAVKGLTVSTFHSLCVRILRNHAPRIGFQPDFTILDESDQRDVLRDILRTVKIDDRKFDLDVLKFALSQAKNNFIDPDQAETYFSDPQGLGRTLAVDYQIAAIATFPRYQERLRMLNGMDFDDLLFLAVKLLQKDEETRELYNFRFRHILVDEYQDTNAAQFTLIRLLTQKQKNLCVVGDDDQSIYGWRGADSTHILEFRNQFPDAHLVVLDQNYRSTPTILEAANSVISQNSKRHPKTLWSDRERGEPIQQLILEDDRAEAEWVADEIERQAKRDYNPESIVPPRWSDYAILYRSNTQSRLFEEALRQRKIPYAIVGGMSFLDRKEIKDILAYWRLVMNPKDDASARRAIQWPARGVGKTTLENLGTAAFTRGISLLEAIAESDASPSAHEARESKGAKAARSFRELIAAIAQDLESLPAESSSMAQWALRSLDKIGAKAALEAESDDPVIWGRKWESVQELAQALGQLTVEELENSLQGEEILTPRVWLREFISRMTLQDQENKENEKDAARETQAEVTLLTLHGAKGLEYPTVFLVGVEEGSLPHKRTLEGVGGIEDLAEERRLCYVGITRAKNLLFITRAKNRIRFGKKVPRLASRFLSEIPESLMITRDESDVPDLNSPQAVEAHEKRVESFLSQISQIKNVLKR